MIRGRLLGQMDQAGRAHSVHSHGDNVKPTRAKHTLCMRTWHDEQLQKARTQLSSAPSAGPAAEVILMRQQGAKSRQ